MMLKKVTIITIPCNANFSIHFLVLFRQLPAMRVMSKILLSEFNEL